MNANDLARKMTERIAAMEPGTSETIARVACEVSGADYSVDEGSLFDLEDEVVPLLDERGIVLDRSAFWGMTVGMPYNIPFEVRPAVNGKRGPIGLDEVERILFSASGYSAGHVDMLLARDETGALLKSVQGFHPPGFVEAFDVPMDENETKALQEALVKCGVESWYREYPHEIPEERVLDGDGWELMVCLSDGTCISCSGDNDYPERFGELTSALIALGFPDFWA